MKKHGTSSNGKRRYRCLNSECPYETFSQTIDYPGRRREVKQQIVEMTLNGSGVRDIARVLHVSTATVIQELKKAPQLQHVNQKLLRQPPVEQLEIVIEQIEVEQESVVEESELDAQVELRGQEDSAEMVVARN